MPIYNALQKLKNQPCPLTIDEAQAFLNQFPLPMQAKLIAAIYTGAGHINHSKLTEDVTTRSESLPLLNITSADYAEIIRKKCVNLTTLYIPALLKCAQASGFDLNNL